MEGGPNTVRTGMKSKFGRLRTFSSCLVHEAVVQNNIPAVFFEGTGRCCDLFAKAYRLYIEYCSKSEQNAENTS